MLNIFSFLYLISIVFVDCENIYLLNNLSDVNALTVFLSLAFLSMAFILREEKGVVRLSNLTITLVIFLLFSAFSFYFSLNPDSSLYPALRILSALFLSLALISYLNNIEALNTALLTIFILAGVHAGIGILQQLSPSLLYEPNRFSFASSSIFANLNYYAGYLVVHIPIGIYLYCQDRTKTMKIVLGGILVMIWIALGFSGSPGGQLVAGIQALGIIFYLLKKKEFRCLKILGGGFIIALGVYIGLVKFLNQLYPSGSEEIATSLIRRPWIWGHVENRFMYWAGAWSLFKENWLLGTGLWTFKEFYPQTGLKYIPPHAHNMYLQTATETGLIGFGLLMACLTTLYLTIIRILKNITNELVDLSFYITVSISSLLLHNLIEYNWLTSNFIYIFVYLVISVEVLNREIASTKMWKNIPDPKKLWPKVIAITMVLGIFTVVQYYRYNRTIGHNVLASNTVEEVLAHAERAKEICGRCGRPHYLSGIVHLEEFRKSKNDRDLVQAEKDFKEVIQRNPLGSGAFFKLGQIKSIQGNHIKAKYFYEKAKKDSRYRSFVLEELKRLESYSKIK